MPCIRKLGTFLAFPRCAVSTPTHKYTHKHHPTHTHKHPPTPKYTSSTTPRHGTTHTHTKNMCTQTQTYSYTEKIQDAHAHMYTHIHTVRCVPCLEPRYPVQCVLQLGLHAASSTNREQVLDPVAGQHYSGPGPWHTALPDQFLSGCQAAGREGSTPSAQRLQPSSLGAGV